MTSLPAEDGFGCWQRESFISQQLIRCSHSRLFIARLVQWTILGVIEILCSLFNRIFDFVGWHWRCEPSRDAARTFDSAPFIASTGWRWKVTHSTPRNGYFTYENSKFQHFQNSQAASRCSSRTFPYWGTWKIIDNYVCSLHQGREKEIFLLRRSLHMREHVVFQEEAFSKTQAYSVMMQAAF